MRLLLVGEPSVTRDAVVDFLRCHSTLDCVDLAADWDEMVDLADQTEFGAILIDIRQREDNGLALATRYRMAGGKVPVILMIDHDLAQYREAVIASGATAFVLRQSLAAELIRLLTALQEQQAV